MEIQPLCIPVSIFEDARLTPFELIVKYLKYDILKSNGFVESLFSFFEPIQDIGKSFPSMESVDNLFTAAGMHYNFNIKIQSKFDDPIPIRRAGYNVTLDMYDFVEFEL
jgi:hypothetical protein